MNNSIENSISAEPEETGVGFLKIKTSTAGGTIPLEGATVYIRNYEPGKNNDVLYSLRTNSSGLTPTVPLETPKASETLKPGDPQPFAYYNVEVGLEGYHPVEFIGLPIFDGITSLQQVVMIPFSETEMFSDYAPPTQIFENRNSYSNLTDESGAGN